MAFSFAVFLAQLCSIESFKEWQIEDFPSTDTGMGASLALHGHFKCSYMATILRIDGHHRFLLSFEEIIYRLSLATQRYILSVGLWVLIHQLSGENYLLMSWILIDLPSLCFSLSQIIFLYYNYNIVIGQLCFPRSLSVVVLLWIQFVHCGVLKTEIAHWLLTTATWMNRR